MHMARLVDPSRLPNQYALAALSETLEEEIEESKREIIEAYRNTGDENAKKCIQIYQEHC